MKEFKESDIKKYDHENIYTNIFRDDLVLCELDWQKRGLQESRTGYGAKLNSGYKIHFEGKLYRVYITCYGNAGSSWFTYKGRKIYVH